ncbi:SprB repeat-containing protein, partial [Flavobacteriaceae bacterium XHP0103]|uniref:chromophore lyase n=1 Tax=Marixanthotalea marina TaxID=2844359 RepID=UPI002989DA51
MKKTTFLKNGIFLFIILFSIEVSVAQNLVPFSPRYDEAIKGDMLLIGNSNLSVHPTDPYTGSTNNEHRSNRDRMVYVDIDSDGTTFNSSSADLDVPTDTNCYQIVYAGLYWSSVVKGDTPMETIKFSTPESGGYIDITGTEVYFQNSSDDSDSNTYVYYRDVTDILAALSNPEGTYGVANISSMTSDMMNNGDGRNTEGLSAGWSLFVIYEDPLLPSKYITSFDGYTKIDNQAPNNLETFPISGFQTIPVGPVRAKFAFSALEGDRSWAGDYLELNGTRIGATNASGTTIRPSDNFFNSSVSIIDPATNSPVLFTDRNPASSNTLGFDAGIINIPNAGNTLIDNGDTSATIRLGTNTDIYYFYFSTFAIEIIAPNIVLTKIVEDSAGNDIGGQYVNLGDELNYVIGFQNTGNDDATDLIIRDVLPINIVFNYPEDIVSLPPGVTVQSYDPATRELIFSVDESVVEENDPVSEIRFKVTVVSTCSLLSDACANNIDNQAYATYKGTINPDFVISDDPSYASNTGCLITPGATNFIADINDCTFEENVVLCGTSTVLTSGSGYDAYTWTNASGTVIGNTQSITVTTPGTYYVHNAAVAPCQSTDQVFNVITYGAGITNPVIPYADEVVICPNDGKELPNIFLCGGNDSEFIETNISDSTSIIWEKLDESSCAAVINDDCANEDPGCTWNQVGTGSDFLANAAGQYRLTINYTGGCFNEFYFNVYQNLLVPTATATDIICSTPGEIRIGNVPSGYEYSIDGTNYQTSNVFSVTTPGTYSIYVRQIGVSTNPCIFTAPDVQIRERDFTVSTIITQPYCNGERGSVAVAANDARPQYFFSISQGGTLVNSLGPVTANDYTFDNLNPGTYTINVSTEDGCVYSEDIEIIEPPLLTATAALTQPLTCTDGEITVYPNGGTAPYYYFVNSTTEFQSSPQIVVTAPGVYNITVVDANNCSAETSITVDATPEPDYTVTATDIACSDSGDTGTISFNVTNAYGSSLMFSIDNGATFYNSSVFTNLAAGSYDVIVQYTIAGSVCTTAPQTVTINIPDPITGTATLTAPYTCTTDGTITVSSVSGGIAPYSYSIDGVNYQSGTTFSGLVNGTYTITIMDSSGCMFATAPITIDALNPPTDMAFSNTPLSCPTNTTDVTITSVTGGTGTLEYQIIAPAASATAYQASNTFTGLAPGTYTFQVRDANSCTYSETYNIAPLPPVAVNTVLTKDLDCTASPDAVISGTVTSGVSPYTYSVSVNGGAYGVPVNITGTTFSYSTLTDGNYQFLITDANGCTVESSVQMVSAIVPVTASIVTNDPTCNGSSNGTVTINALSGVVPFSYSLDGGTTFVSSNVFGGLVAGNYSYVVRDSKGCSVSGTATLNDPLPLDVSIVRNPIQCNSNVPGSLDVTINSGGVAPYIYTLYNSAYSQVGGSVNTSSTTHTFSGLSFGDYYVTITDSNGCEYMSGSQRIETPPNIQLDGNTSTGSCATGATVDISVITGAAPFTYSIYGQPSTAFGPTASTSHTFTNLNHGVTYFFQVVDAGGCYSIIEVTTPTLSNIDIDTITASNVSCNGDSDGSVSFSISDYDASVTSLYYEVQDALTNAPIVPSQNGTFIGLSGSPASGSITGLPAGNYVLFVRETNGTFCTTSRPFQITQPIQPLFSAVSNSINANCNVDAQITLNTSGGTGPYQYAVGAAGFTPAIGDFDTNNVLYLDPTVRTNWDIVVRDSNGCEVRLNETIASDPEPIIAAVLDNQCDTLEGQFSIDVSMTTFGVGPYTYSIDGGVFQSRTAPFTISNLSSGTHTIEVKDFNGCGNLVTVDIESPLTLTAETTIVPTCDDDDGEITVNVTGGSGSYSYSISPSAASVSLSGNVFSGVPSGIYVITITDINTSCFEEVTVVVPETIPPTVTLTPVSDIICFGDSDGSFELSVSNYTGAYDYEVFDGGGVSVRTVTGASTSTNPVTVS